MEMDTSGTGINSPPPTIWDIFCQPAAEKNPDLPGQRFWAAMAQSIGPHFCESWPAFDFWRPIEPRVILSAHRPFIPMNQTTGRGRRFVQQPGRLAGARPRRVVPLYVQE